MSFHFTTQLFYFINDKNIEDLHFQQDESADCWKLFSTVFSSDKIDQVHIIWVHFFINMASAYKAYTLYDLIVIYEFTELLVKLGKNIWSCIIVSIADFKTGNLKMIRFALFLPFYQSFLLPLTYWQPFWPSWVPIEHKIWESPEIFFEYPKVWVKRQPS